MGSFSRFSWFSLVAFDSLSVSDSELKSFLCSNMAVLAFSLDSLRGCLWTLVFSNSSSFLSGLAAMSLGFTGGDFEHEDWASLCKDRTFVTRNKVSLELSS